MEHNPNTKFFKAIASQIVSEDPYGDVIAECPTLGDDITVGLCTPEKIRRSLGRRFIAARRPGIYREMQREATESAIVDPGWDTEA